MEKKILISMEINKMAINGYDLGVSDGKIIKSGSRIFLKKANFLKEGKDFLIEFEHEGKDYKTGSALEDNTFDSLERCKEVIDDYFMVSIHTGRDDSFFPNGSKVVHWDDGTSLARQSAETYNRISEEKARFEAQKRPRKNKY